MRTGLGVVVILAYEKALDASPGGENENEAFQNAVAMEGRCPHWPPSDVRTSHGSGAHEARPYTEPL